MAYDFRKPIRCGLGAHLFDIGLNRQITASFTLKALDFQAKTPGIERSPSQDFLPIGSTGPAKTT